MRAIITVLGKDRVGIIAEVCTFLSQRQVNIRDLSQTIVQGFFSMIMIVELGEETAAQFEQTARALRAYGEAIGMEIKLQREDIFEVTHRI
jgi:ACT domain-containing protein